MVGSEQFTRSFSADSGVYSLAVMPLGFVHCSLPEVL